MLHIFFQEIPSIQIGFGFAVELFIIIFSCLCWLFYDDVPSVSVVEEEIIPAVPDTLKVEEEFLTNIGKPYCESVKAVVEGLNLHEARKIAAHLKDLKLISSDIKVSGNGIGRVFLVGLIKDKVSEYYEAIGSALTEILGKTIG